MSAPMEKPRLIVQCDWEQVFRDRDGKAWVSYRLKGQPSVYGELTPEAVSGSGDPYISASDGFAVDAVSKRLLTVRYECCDTRYSCKFQAPNVTFSTIHKPNKKVTCIDVTDGGLAVSCDTEEKLKIWTTNNGEVRRDLVGHFGDVYTCRFFPSGLVVLTGGADMQLKVWSAETGQCAATLIGHKAGVTDTAIVERGRNIVSCSSDGTAKLWDCGTRSCLGTVEECGGPLNACCLGVPEESFGLGYPDEPPGEKEVLTCGKLLLLACENGTLQGYGLQSRKKVFEAACGDAVNCCYFVSPTSAICGTQDGQLYVWDIRNMSEPVHHWHEGRSAILSMLPCMQGMFVTAGDGSCFYINEELETSLELTGPDCDPVYKISTDKKHLYTACRDGAIRKYVLANL